jgi:LacI family transcriptional regulator
MNQGMPVVMFDRVTNDILCDKVIIDDGLAAVNTTQYLIDKGFKKIALITTVDYVSVGKLRTEGYIKSLKNNDISIDENLILKIEDTNNFEDQIENLIVKNKPEAIFAVNEIFAVTAIKIATKLDIKVPEELSIIGFTDGIISKYSSPSITTVSQNGVKMGNKAAMMLINRLDIEDEEEEPEEHYKTEVIETHLVERESTI